MSEEEFYNFICEVNKKFINLSIEQQYFFITWFEHKRLDNKKEINNND